MNQQHYLALRAAVRDIASVLPTGLADPNARIKLAAEEDELVSALRAGDRLGALTELADVAYYAVKAELNDLLSQEQAKARTATAARLVGVPLDRIGDLVQAKYATRVRGVKDDEHERAAVARLKL